MGILYSKFPKPSTYLSSQTIVKELEHPISENIVTDCRLISPCYDTIKLLCNLVPHVIKHILRRVKKFSKQLLALGIPHIPFLTFFRYGALLISVVFEVQRNCRIRQTETPQYPLLSTIPSPDATACCIPCFEVCSQRKRLLFDSLVPQCICKDLSNHSQDTLGITLGRFDFCGIYTFRTFDQ